MTATPSVLDLRRVQEAPPRVKRPRGPDEQILIHPRSSEGFSLTPKQIRARARRRIRQDVKRHRQGKPPKHPGKSLLTDEELKYLYKPLEDWDLEELARGRPRSASGKFTGKNPAWMTRELFEAAQDKFKQAVKMDMNGQTITALQALNNIFSDFNVDDKGKPTTSASVKLQAAQFLLEHTVGKPKQEVVADVSVKLQGVLAAVMANPNDALASGALGGRSPDAIEPAYKLGYFPGFDPEPEGVEDAELLDG